MGDEASQIRLRMQELDQERQTLERRLRELQQLKAEPPGESHERFHPLINFAR
jgi:hypothetical protein